MTGENPEPGLSSSSARRSLKIAILTSGRFHVLDLARELVALGHDVTFYSLLPPSRLAARRLDPARGVWVGIGAIAPALVQRRLKDGRVKEVVGTVAATLIDYTAARRLRPCDVVIAMAGMGYHTLAKAKKVFGAVTIVERSSQHIQAQMEVLGLSTESASIRREVREYRDADYISVPSTYCRQTFIDRGFSIERMLLNPFGVSLEEFPLTQPAPESPPRMIMVGTWSRQKGSDVLIDALRLVRQVIPTAELLHVGSRGDFPMPIDEPGFTHVDPVPQTELSGFYRTAHVGVLASRQEGLATVQAQILASGLPLVCTERTGGADLAALLDGGPPVTVVQSEAPEQLAEALIDMLKSGQGAGFTRHPLSKLSHQRLAWSGYAERWDRTLQSIVPRKPKGRS